MNKVWTPTPLPTAIIEILEKKKSMIDKELLKELEGRCGKLSLRELNNALMKLEILGKVRVSKLVKGRRMVELASRRP
ncbi:TPA: hypothetical protein EYP26_04465 [Candidatus Bathyarchaeota archaeon]|nr:hypothetical protein [Candidatus Bathyarchaeota archaeon]